MRADGRTNEVRLQDLRFTRSETASFIAGTTGVGVSDSALEHLKEKIEGWAVGLRLVSLALKHASSPDDLISGMGEGLSNARDYLLHEVLEALAPPDRARAQRLATETMRWAGRADRVLGPFLRRKPEPAVHGLLRLGVWEICADGAAPYGVVDALVTILKESGAPKGQTGFVNAVLRRAARDGLHPPDGDSLDLLAALLPCSWGYLHIAQRMRAAGPSPIMISSW